MQSPVIIAGLSGQVRGLVAAIRSFGQPGSPKCVVVEGGDGSGKSLAAAAFQAVCQAGGTDVVLVNEGSEPASVIQRVGAGGALIVDNLDQLPAGLRRALFERRHSVSIGSLLTVSRLSPLERELLSTDDDHHLIGRWEDRAPDVLIIATLMWRRLGLKPDLPDLCAEGVPEAFGRGPWPKGAHSIRRVIDLLAEALALEGYFERTPRPITVADVLSALVAVIREEQPPEQEEVIRIVVEGRTDATYLEAAAQFAYEEWGTDLLSGCCVAPAGEDREGGAESVVRQLISLEAQGITAVGLFDDDEPGRMAAKVARRYTNQKVYLLPREFEPLRNPDPSSKIEIEDLVPTSLLERFFEEHSELGPEERTTRGDLTRIVVAGLDKERVASWICEHASFKEMAKVVYVLCILRRGIGLPLPDACPPLDDWIRKLGGR